jgi:thymidylate synthase (FAD)
MLDPKDVDINATNPLWVNCLDHGFVHLVDWMGNDQRIVDAARVSYQQGTKAVQSDRHLIRYLMKNLHTTPFEKVVFEFHVKLPIFVARQWMRHRTGSFNEVSARYSVMKDEFYIPSPLRKQSTSNRQGSSDEVVEVITETGYPNTSPKFYFENKTNNAYHDYEVLLANGTARELARCVLPVSLYTEFYWTVNLWNLMHFLKLRLDKHAQLEVRVFADAIYKIISECCDLPFALEAFQDYILEDPKISKYELEIIRDTLLGNKQKEIEPPVDALPQNFKSRMQWLIDNHPDMSTREKQESKLVEYFFSGE